MAQPYVGEIRMFGGNFAPAGWAFCEGQLLPISENETLFTADRHDLRRRRAGDLRPARPAGPRSDPPGHRPGLRTSLLGETGGVETVTLTTQQIPSTTTPLLGSTDVAAHQRPARTTSRRHSPTARIVYDRRRAPDALDATHR